MQESVMRWSDVVPECQENSIPLLSSCPVLQNGHGLDHPKQIAFCLQHELVALFDIVLLSAQQKVPCKALDVANFAAEVHWQEKGGQDMYAIATYLTVYTCRSVLLATMRSGRLPVPLAWHCVKYAAAQCVTPVGGWTWSTNLLSCCLLMTGLGASLRMHGAVALAYLLDECCWAGHLAEVWLGSTSYR